jgi:hypothetical protein
MEGRIMDIDNAAEILAGSILIGLALIIVVITMVAINNIVFKYWKPMRIFTADSFQFNPPSRFVDPEEVKIPPKLDESGKTKT